VPLSQSAIIAGGSPPATAADSHVRSRFMVAPTAAGSSGGV
jgi:hypothetical protein